MVPVSNILACYATLFISFLLPILAIFVLFLRHRREGLLSGWVVGALGFFVSQMVLRTPLLRLLSPQLQALALAHPLVFALGLAFTAALFELAGRLAAAKLLEKKLTFRRSLAAGMGHGAIESILIVGLAYVTNLYYISLIQSGEFDALVAQLSQVEGAAEQMEAARQALIATPAGMFLLAGAERLLTMVCHGAMSLLVCYSLRRGRVWRGAGLCLAFHTLLDGTAGVAMVAFPGAQYRIIYGVLTGMAVLSACTIIALRRRWPVEEKGEVKA